MQTNCGGNFEDGFPPSHAYLWTNIIQADFISRANVFDLHKSLINFSTRPRFTKHWANRSTATDVTRLWPTNFQTIINIHISRIRAKLLFIASHLLTRNCEHPLGPIHLQYLSKVFQHLLERLRRAKVQQDSTLRFD